MKYNRIAFIALIGSAMLLAASCVEEVTSNEDLYRPAGTPISLSAETGYDNGIETRAEYSGYLYGSAPAYERIDWENGDKIRIIYNGDSNNYIVNSVSGTSDRNSYAGITGNELYWDGSSSHTFYALYPCDQAYGGSGTTTGYLETDGTVRGSIPAQQNVDPNNTVTPSSGSEAGITKYRPNTDQYGYLVSYKNISGTSSETSVTLPFRPAVTTFEFKLQRRTGNADRPVRSFVLSTESNCNPLTGGFQFRILNGDNNGATWNTALTGQDPTTLTGSNGHSITVEFPAANFPTGVTIPSTGYLDFSFLALPIDLSGVSLTINYVDGGQKTLKLKDNVVNGDPSTGTWHTFTGAKKYIITNTSVPGSTNWIYKIEEIDDITTYGHLAVSSDVGIVSYRYLEENGSPVPGSYEAVAWKAQYNDGTTWNDWTATQGDFSFGSSYTGNGVSNITTNELRSVSLVDNTNYTSTGHQSSTYILQHRNPVTNYSLCDHDLYGNSINSSTANTYVVTTSGSYNFPCVYGNGIENGSINTAAYNSPNFRNAINSGIQNPWINTDFTGRELTLDGVHAVVVWQDEQIISATPTATLIGGNYWINFSIAQNEIKPGNVVIALKGTVKQNGSVFANLNDVILWSWQIWVTDQDLTPVDYLMPYNLGWNIDGDVQTIQYTNRELPIRIQQIAPSDDPSGAIDHEDFTFTQLADAAQIYELAIGSNPYYQWGRKDPMIPGLYSPVANERGDYCIDKPFYPSTEYSSMSSRAEDPGSNKEYAEYGYGIRKPYVGYHNDWSTGWIGGNHSVVGDTGVSPYNLWDNYRSATTYSSSDSGVHKIKTVYDPCPYGFTVPVQSRFNGYVLEGNTGATEGGIDFNTGIFLPYSGARIFYNRIAWGEYDADHPGPAIPAELFLRHVNDKGLYWTDTPCQDVRFSKILLFDKNVVNYLDYTRGTAAAIRPMVDPKHPLTPPASSAAPGGSINPFNNGGEIPE